MIHQHHQPTTLPTKQANCKNHMQHTLQHSYQNQKSILLHIPKEISICQDGRLCQQLEHDCGFPRINDGQTLCGKVWKKWRQWFFCEENCFHLSSFGSLGQEVYQLHTYQTPCIEYLPWCPSFQVDQLLQTPVVVPNENDHKPPFDEETPHCTTSNERVVSLYHLKSCLLCWCFCPCCDGCRCPSICTLETSRSPLVSSPELSSTKLLCRRKSISPYRGSWIFLPEVQVFDIVQLFESLVHNRLPGHPDATVGTHDAA